MNPQIKLREQISEIEQGIREVKASGGEGFTVKQFERTKKGLIERLKKLEARERKDSVVTFDVVSQIRSSCSMQFI